VSQPPEYPGRQRLRRAAGSAGSDAYQGAFEAVGSVLISCAAGWWVDSRWDTAPWGLLVGTVIGFAAMVLRLLRLGKELHPDSDAAKGGVDGGSVRANAREEEDDWGVGRTPGMSSVLRDDDDASDDEGNGRAR
jgi:F0F1-type ATP synthase assembly protein I